MFKHGDIVKVLVANNINNGYDYYLNEDAPLGAIVQVSILNKHYLGIIIGQGENSKKYKIKPILSVLKSELNNQILTLSKNDILWIEKVSKWNFETKGSILKLILTVDVFNTDKQNIHYTFNNINSIKLTEKRKIVKNIFLDIQKPLSKKDIVKLSKVSISVINSMIKDNLLLQTTYKMNDENFVSNYYDTNKIKLNDEQKHAVNLINKIILTENNFHVFVLNGITGSGKTQVYFDSVLKIYNKGLSALIMMPEIALTTQFIEKFKQKFGFPPIVWHSNLTNKERKKIWINIIEKKIRIIIGTRSALFLPWQDLGLIVVDEEHDSSYKQEDNTLYQARDMAILKAKINNFPIILASATPSFETIHNIKLKKYTEIKLTKRYANATLPDIKLIDLRKERIENYDNKKGFISNLLLNEIKKTIANNQQVMLFINRRGYANIIQCEKCGYVKKCDNCDIALTYHKKINKLICHMCGKWYTFEKNCEKCGSKFNTKGAGLEKIEEEIKAKIDNVTTAIISSDTVNSTKTLSNIIKDIENKKIDIVIGTQILTKGHHFPSLTLVGIIDGDMGLYAPDFRAFERSYQQLIQTAGRSGRGNINGQVMIQTYNPDNEVFKAIIQNNVTNFINSQLILREKASMPPFKKLIAIIIESKDEKKLKDACTTLLNNKPNIADTSFMGPISSDVYVIRNWFRMRFLIVTKNNIDLTDIIENWLICIKKIANIKIKIDTNPYNFF